MELCMAESVNYQYISMKMVRENFLGPEEVDRVSEEIEIIKKRLQASIG